MAHPVIERIEESLAGIVPPEPLEIRGSWSQSIRRTYRGKSRSGSGAGRFVDVVDVRWSGIVEGAMPVAGVAFLHHGRSIHWVKSPPASLNLAVEVSLHAYADDPTVGATFTGRLGDALVPGVPVRCGPDLANACAIGPARAATGRSHRVAEVDGVAFIVLLFPGALLKTGRNRLWRLRDAWTPNLPADVRDLLTRQRAGVL